MPVTSYPTQNLSQITPHAIQERRLALQQGAYTTRKEEKRSSGITSKINLDFLQDSHRVNDTEMQGVTFKNGRFEPAVTAHPTSPLSYDYQIFQSKLDRVTKISEHLKGNCNHKLHEKIIELRQLCHDKFIDGKSLWQNSHLDEKSTDIQAVKKLSNNLKKHLENKIKNTDVVSHTPLTPDQEVSLAIETSYTTMFLESFAILRNNGKNVQEPVLGFHSWAGGDADGNKNVTPEVTEDTIKKHTAKTAQLYHDAIEKYFSGQENHSLPLKQAVNALNTVITASQSGDNIDGSLLTKFTKIASENLTGFLAEKLKDINLNNPSQERQTEHALAMQKMLENFPITGPKLDIRQSADALDECLLHISEVITDKTSSDILSRVSQRCSENHGIKKFYRDLDDDIINNLNDPENIQHKNKLKNIIADTIKGKSVEDRAARDTLMSSLLSSPDVLISIADAYKADQENGINSEGWKELKRMMVIQGNPEIIERYRISDARDISDLKCVRLLEKIAQTALKTEEKPKLNVIPLTETQDDIERLPETIAKMLDEGVNLEGKLTIFVGFSDIEKRMGITGGIIGIAKALLGVKKAIDNHNEKCDNQGTPEKKVLHPKLSYGGGEDITRGAHCYKSDSTMQGRQGMELGLMDYFKDRLKNVTSFQDNIDETLAQINELDNPNILKAEQNKILETIVNSFQNSEPNIDDLPQDIQNSLGKLNSNSSLARTQARETFDRFAQESLDNYKSNFQQPTLGSGSKPIEITDNKNPIPLGDVNAKAHSSQVPGGNVSSRAGSKSKSLTEEQKQKLQKEQAAQFSEKVAKKEETIKLEKPDASLADYNPEIQKLAQSFDKHKKDMAVSLVQIDEATEKARNNRLASVRPVNLDTLRAIGEATWFATSGSNLQAIAGSVGYGSIDDLDAINDMNIVKEANYKVLYSVAISDPERFYLGLKDHGIKPKSPTELMAMEYHDKKEIFDDYYSDDKGKVNAALGRYAENIFKFSIDVAKHGAKQFGGDAAVEYLDKSLKNGDELAKAVQNLLVNIKDFTEKDTIQNRILAALGNYAQKLTARPDTENQPITLDNSGSGALLTEFLKHYKPSDLDKISKYTPNEIKSDPNKSYQRQDLDSILLLQRELQTVPKEISMLSSFKINE